jgi:hypothetical protein
MSYLGAAEPFIAGFTPALDAGLNYNAIQSALDSSKSVFVDGPGIYEINRTLVVRDGGALILGSGVTIKQAQNTNLSLVVNEGYYRQPSNITLTWTSGPDLQVNWTAHGLSVGDYVSIYNVNPSAFNGVYRVKTVTSANVAQVEMHRDPAFGARASVTNGSPTVTLQQACPFSLAGYSLVTNDAATIYTVSAHTANSATVTLSGNYSGTTSTNFTRRGTFTLAPVALSGSILAKKADSNIRVEGGIWDYNNSGNQSTAQTPDRHALLFGHLADSSIKNVEGVNATKYIVCLGAATNVTVDGVNAPAHISDIVKIYGPAKNVLVNNVTGVSGDDAVSFQTKEPDAFVGYRFAFGDIIDCKCYRVSVESSAGQGSVTLYGSNEELLTGMDVQNVYGEVSDNGAVFVIGNGSGLIGRYGTVRASGIRGYVQGATGAALRLNAIGSGEADISIDDYEVQCINGIQTQSSPVVRTFEISRMIPRDYGTAGDPVNLNGITAQRINIDRCQFDFLTPSATKYCISAAGATNIGYFAVTRNVNRTNWFFAALDCTLRDVLVAENENTGASDHFIRVNSASGTPTIRMINNATNTLAVFNPSVSCTVYFSGNRCSGATNGIVRTATNPTVVIQSGGNNLVSGSWVVVPSGTPVLTVYGWDIAIDPIALTGLATTAGQYGTSTRAAANGGPFVRTSVGWMALGTGAAGVNTIIT